MSKAELKEIEATFQNNLKSVLPEYQISAKNNVLNILFRSMASYIYQLIRKSNKYVDCLTEIDSVTGTQLDYRASFYSITRIQKTKATGVIIYLGNLGGVIPVGSYVLGGSYIVTSTSAIALQSFHGVVSVNLQQAIVTLPNTNILPNNIKILVDFSNIINQEVTISNCNETTFSFSFEGSIPSGDYPITFNTLIGIISISSVEEGENQNLEGNTQGELSNLFDNVLPNLYVSPQGITGGQDLESDVRLKKRWRIARAGYVAYFSPDHIKLQLLSSFPNMTRVFVLRATPATGKCTIYALFENRLSILPNQSEINEIKNYLSTLAPATISGDDMIVGGVILLPMDIQIINVTPNTIEMNLSARKAVGAFFLNEVEVGQSVTPEAIRTYLLPNTADINNNKLINIEIVATTNSAQGNELIVLGEIN